MTVTTKDIKEINASTIEGVDVLGPMTPGYDRILTTEAVAFIADLHRKFEPRRRELMARRIDIQAGIDGGKMPDFLAETAKIRAGDWIVAPIPADLQNRRVEITGPTDRKMVINALNSGANTFMADFEDSSTPTWANAIEGQINLADAVRREIAFTDPESG